MNLSQKSKYIFAHNVLLINEEIFENLNLWFPFFDLKKIYGEEIFIKNQKNNSINLILLLQYLINKIPSDFVVFSTLNGKFRQRTLLALINSLKHTINLADSIDIKPQKNWKEFVKKFNKFRENWFTEENRDKQLFDFIFESIKISFQLISEVDKYLTNNLKIKTKADSFKLKLPNKEIIFIKDWKNLENKINAFPISFGVFIYLWIESKTKIGEQISKRISEELVYSCPKNLINKFNKYALILEDYNRFSKKKFNMTTNGYHILWMPFYNNKIKNKIHNLIFKFSAWPYILLNKIKSL
jgi:hypothetical protein